MLRAGSGLCDGFRKARENDVAPPGAHALESVGHSLVVKIKAAVLQEHSGASTFLFKALGEGPG